LKSLLSILSVCLLHKCVNKRLGISNSNYTKICTLSLDSSDECITERRGWWPSNQANWIGSFFSGVHGLCNDGFGTLCISDQLGLHILIHGMIVFNSVPLIIHMQYW